MALLSTYLATLLLAMATIALNLQPSLIHYRSLTSSLTIPTTIPYGLPTTQHSRFSILAELHCISSNFRRVCIEETALAFSVYRCLATMQSGALSATRSARF